MTPEPYVDAIRLAQAAPVGQGRVDFLINRPNEGVHTPVDELYFDVEKGILGDRWQQTAWLRLPDGRPDPRVQVSVTNTNVMRCFIGEHSEGVFSCGDNVYTNLNLSELTLPVGSRLQIGEAIIEVSDVVNDACGKFSQRFGKEAFACVRAAENAPLRLRGLFARIVQSGAVASGDIVALIGESSMCPVR
ncbi:MAG: MOSC domain-containing protein [Opitutaceae bacterium]